MRPTRLFFLAAALALLLINAGAAWHAYRFTHPQAPRSGVGLALESLTTADKLAVLPGALVFSLLAWFALLTGYFRFFGIFRGPFCYKRMRYRTPPPAV